MYILRVSRESSYRPMFDLQGITLIYKQNYRNQYTSECNKSSLEFVVRMPTTNNVVYTAANNFYKFVCTSPLWEERARLPLQLDSSTFRCKCYVQYMQSFDNSQLNSGALIRQCPYVNVLISSGAVPRRYRWRSIIEWNVTGTRGGAIR